MIHVFKSLPSIISAPMMGLATAALTPLFVISTRVLTEPADHAVRLPVEGVAQTRVSRHLPSPAPGPAGAQWRQIAQGIEGRIQSLRNAVEQQSAACVQLDAADFALGKIVEELAAIMPRASELRRQTPRGVPRPRAALAA